MLLMDRKTTSKMRNSSVIMSNLTEDTVMLIHEILKMDRLLYLNIIREKEFLTSLQLTREILALRNDLKPKQIKGETVLKNNPNINKRLKDLVDLGILNAHEGKYSLSSIGSIIINELTRLNSNTEILKEYKWFFDTHDYTVIPPQYLCEIHNLQFAKQCKDAIEYNKEIGDNTAKANSRIRIATDHLHDIHGWIIEELKQGNLTLKLVYQFKEPFTLNFGDEEEEGLWRDLTQKAFPAIELRYMALKERSPIGIRIIDKRWAILNLLERAENKLNRPLSFYGTDEQFMGWVEDIFSSIWNVSNPLELDNVHTESL